MNAQELQQLAIDHLLPFFSGANIEPQAVASTPREQCIAFTGPCTIGFKVNKDDAERLQLRRSQPFQKDTPGVITEKNVVEAFVNVLRDIQSGLDATYREDLLATLPRRVVGKAIGAAGADSTILATLDQFSNWSTRLYEGHQITAAIGFVPNDNTQSVSLQEVWKHDFSAVITNGHDTLLTANEAGHVLGHVAIPMPPGIPSFAPYRLAPIAEWARDGRLAVVLNRVGEILVLKDRKLVFARRSGAWHFLTHDAVLTQIARPDNTDIRRAILETAIDVSFARSGGCIGVVTSTNRAKWREVVVNEDDYVQTGNSTKASTMQRLVNGRPFQDLDRRLRQELVTVDGATVIDHHGEVLAVGAILKIPGGSTGGGRLAAAKALSVLGLGVKISQDGGIRCYHDNNADPRVALM